MLSQRSAALSWLFSPAFFLLLLMSAVMTPALRAGDAVVSKPTATPEAQKTWDARLYAKVRELAAAGHGPSLNYLGKEAYIASADQAGHIELRSDGSLLAINWKQLDWSLRPGLAQELVRLGGISERPILAFFLLESGQTREAAKVLAMISVEDQQSVRGSVTIPPAPLPPPPPAADGAETAQTGAEKPSSPVASAPESSEPDPGLTAQARPLPNQFMVFDCIAVHTEDSQSMGAQGYGHQPTYSRTQPAPTDWRAPVDFVGGSHYIRYEILEKPNRRKVHFSTVLSTPMETKDTQDLNSHPGSPETLVPLVALETGLFATGFGSTYQGKPWNWSTPPQRFWEDTYRPGSMMYGPSSVFPLKVRLTMYLFAKGFKWHPYGNLAGLDFRNLRHSAESAQAINEGRLGAALTSAQRASGKEARWIMSALAAHADLRVKEVRAYCQEEPDCAADEFKALAAEFAGSDVGKRLKSMAEEMDLSDATKRARKARVLWSAVLSTANRIEVPDGLGDEHWDAKITMPDDLQKKYTKELAAIRSGVGELLPLINGRNWTRMAKALLHNLGQE